MPLIMAVVTRLPLGLVAKGTPLPAAFHPGVDWWNGVLQGSFGLWGITNADVDCASRSHARRREPSRALLTQQTAHRQSGGQSADRSS